MINKLPKISAPTWISREKETFRFYRKNRGREKREGLKSIRQMMSGERERGVVKIKKKWCHVVTKVNLFHRNVGEDIDSLN